MTTDLPHIGKPSQCELCDRHISLYGWRFHPESDVGPWDEACPGCRHVGGHTEDCSIAKAEREAEEAL